MGKKIAGVYDVEYPVVNRCQNGRYSTTPGRRACTRNGGVDLDYTPGKLDDENFEEDFFIPQNNKMIDTVALDTDKRYQVLEAMKGNRYNIDKLVKITGRKKQDINQRWYKLRGGKDPYETVNDLVMFNELFDPWDDSEVIDILDELVQRNYNDNMELITAGYTFNPEIFGHKKRNNVLGLAILGLSIFALKNY
jgi:hypothetical protein